MDILEKFCGHYDVKPSLNNYKPVSQPWSSVALIGHLQISDLRFNDFNIKDFEPTLWNDLCSEFDAENFCNYLKQSKVDLSEEFKAFEFVWRRDELNHTYGFRHLYSIFYDADLDSINSRLISKEVDFRPIAHLLKDEFIISLLIAYDEIATTKSYIADFDLYAGWGDENLAEWIKLVARDEAYHFNNCINLIKYHFKDRIEEVPYWMNKFVEWDLNGGDYKGTFVLDHDGHYFTEEFLLDCKRIILNKFNFDGK